MSTELLTACIKKIIKIHQTFNELAKEKTICLTKGDIAPLQSLIQKEAVLIKQLQNSEAERVRLVQFFLQSKGFVTESGTFVELLSRVSGHEKVGLLELQTNLINEIETLKKQNDLNQQLIQDSLRFVNLSLDVLLPEHDTGNYGRPDKDREQPSGRPLFDSKA